MIIHLIFRSIHENFIHENFHIIIHQNPMILLKNLRLLILGDDGYVSINLLMVDLLIYLKDGEGVFWFLRLNY